MKYRFEFLYDRGQNITTMYIWNGTQILDKIEMPGKMTSYMKTKMKKETLENIENN